MKHRSNVRSIIALMGSTFLSASLFAAALEEVFTYQGQLKQDGVPANGEFDFLFRLFDESDLTVGDQICLDNVVVVNGLFTVDLDFGTVFNGDALKLQISVRAGGAAGNCSSGVYTILAPRQPILPAPYAIHALSAPNGHALDASDGSPVDALSVNAVGDVGIGTATPGGRLHIVGAVPPPPSQVGANNGILLGSNGTSSYKWIQSYGGPLSLNLMGNFVGVGTASAEANLHVYNGSAGIITPATHAPLVIESNTHAYINILTPDNSESGVLFGRPGAVITNATGGMVFNGAGNQDGLHLRTGGNQTRMTIDSVGDVGIGTSTPNGKLHITGAAPPPPSQAGANNGLLLGSNGEASYKWIQSYGGPLALNAQGNFVGIGTTTPGFPLTFPNALGDKISLWGQSGNHFGLGIQSALLQIHTDIAASDIAFGTGSSAAFTERMRIKGTGNVGIGTASPSHLLHVAGPARFRSNSFTNLLLTGSGDDAFIDFIKDSNFTPSARIAFDGYGDQATHQAFIEFLTRGPADVGLIERMRLTNIGDLGLGTTVPAFRLDVVDEGSGETVAHFHKSLAGTHSAVTVESLTGQDPILYLAQGGTTKWGIRNDASDEDAFQVRWHGEGTNDTILDIRKRTDGEWLMSIDGNVEPAVDADYLLGNAVNRWFSVWATNAFIQTSDARQKKDVVALDYGLKELLSLRPVSFKWKTDSDPRVHLGLISQEVEPIVPEAVVKDPANPETPWAMTYTTLIPVLIKAVQEQHGIIEAHRDRVDELVSQEARERAALKNEKDAKIAELEARIARLEELMQIKAANGN